MTGSELHSVVAPTCNVPGWASTTVALLFLGVAKLMTLGVDGEYLGRVYAEVRRRPLDLVDEVRGFESGSTEDDSASSLIPRTDERP